MLSRDRVNWLFEDGPRILGRLDSGPGVGTEIDPHELASFMGTSASEIALQNVVWVDATGAGRLLLADTGYTPALGRMDRPYATIKTAHDAAIAAGGTWLIHVRAGEYTDTDLTFGDADSLIAYHADAHVVHHIAGPANLFGLNSNFGTNKLIITGGWRWVADDDSTGCVLKIGTSAVYGSLHLHGQEIRDRPTVGRAARSIEIGAPGTDEASGYSIIDIDAVYSNHQVGWCAIQIACSGQFLLRGRTWQALDIEFNPTVHIDLMFGQNIRISPNAFSGPNVRIRAIYLKCTGPNVAAVSVRAGIVRIEGAIMDCTDSASPPLRITSNASTDFPPQVALTSCSLRNWGGGGAPNTTPLIRFDAVHPTFKLALNACRLTSEFGTEYSISASGAQEIEVHNGTTANLPLDPNISVLGTPVTVEAGFATSF